MAVNQILKRLLFEFLWWAADKPLLWRITSDADIFGLHNGFLVANPEDSYELIRAPYRNCNTEMSDGR